MTPVVGSGVGSGEGSGLCAMDHQLRYVDRIDGVEAAWTPPTRRRRDRRESMAGRDSRRDRYKL